MPAIHVCPLSQLHSHAAAIGASHVLTLLSEIGQVTTPASIAAGRHLKIEVNDIEVPQEGLVAPDPTHIAQVIMFARRWPARAPLLIHCYAGISRSTAAAFISLCARAPERSESDIAAELRAASHTASPNRLMVRIADAALDRDGRMIAAIEAIGRGVVAAEATPFRLSASVPA